jgi:aminoglycoside/choline kinase family phosphotransferase
VLHDAGTMALQDVVLGHGPSAPQTLAAYRRVLDTLGALQRVPAQDCAEMADRPFSLVDLRWETEYFRDNFLGRHLGWDLSADAELTADFEALARRVLDEPLFPMHRDFQSQNVFVDGEAIWILDFQGARLGPLPYDLASLLRDPYVSLPADTEDVLLRHYHAQAMPPVTRYAGWDDFRAAYALVSLQRLMQALGAYGFLTLVKGKPWFARWISPALQNLSRAVEEVDGLPRLREVVREALERGRA